MKQFSEILKEKRQARDYSQRWLSIKLGVSVGIVSLWERGKHQPNLPQLVKLADVLGCTIDELAGRTSRN